MDIWREKLEVYKIPIGLSLVGIVLIIGGWYMSDSRPREFPKESQVTPSVKVIKIDISGEVVRPGVYELNEGSRIEDLIKAAGGFSATADYEFIDKKLNLAQKLSDGTKIYIPKPGEAQIGVSFGNSYTSIISINQSNLEELKALPGVGDVTAKKIIDGRPYGSLEDLVGKKIISNTLFEKIKSQISQ